jgi:REP element-mobilizing transposase RayT
MGSYTSLLYQIVWATKHRHACMKKETRQHVFAYISGILKKKNCRPYIVNGVEDHLHILTHIHQTVPISKLVAEIKKSSHHFIDNNGLFPGFTNWQNGYGVFFLFKGSISKPFQLYTKPGSSPC